MERNMKYYQWNISKGDYEQQESWGIQNNICFYQKMKKRRQFYYNAAMLLISFLILGLLLGLIAGLS